MNVPIQEHTADSTENAGMTALETKTEHAPTARGTQTAGWYDDPQGDHRLRYFNGDGWTDHVTHFGPTPCIRCADPSS